MKKQPPSLSASDFSDCAAKNAKIQVRRIPVKRNADLMCVTFTPKKPSDNPEIVFVPGWISLISGWKPVLQEMSKDFVIHYLESREKISADISRKEKFGVKEVGMDIADTVKHLNLQNKSYILLGSSLGATAILDGYKSLPSKPECLVLIGPNAEFRVPLFWKIIITFFHPWFYLFLKPVIKWYLRTFRMKIKADKAQYEKYCRAIDSADPWRLKKAAVALWGYQVWDLLGGIDTYVLAVGAAEDKLHEPENLQRMIQMLPKAEYLDIGTNTRTHQPEMVEQLQKYLNKLRKN